MHQRRMKMDKYYGKDYICTVRNNPVGRLWLWYFKRILNNKGYRLLLRARHSNRKRVEQKYNNGERFYGHCHRDIPKQYAEYWGVYLRRK